ncbi:MAG TPA: hypothetical protein DCP90_03900 [Clostridiales bacterium]|nr:MAG: hypothetical protein A2Y22_04045 [Clostridiales bacterium GWD2_32_59]HAN09739.1 hypothetical protein [Clostridiales bacterium]
MKKIYILIIIFCALFMFSGCEKIVRGRIELEKTGFIRAAGFDKSEKNDDNVKLTFALKGKSSGGDAKQPASSGFSIITEEGKTLFDTNRKVRTFVSKNIFWGHLFFILIGEDAAKDDIVKYLDFVTRNQDIRLTSHVIIVKGTTAEDAINKIRTKDITITETLSSLVHNSGELSVASELELGDIIQMLDCEYACAYIPYIELNNKIKEEEEKEGKEVLEPSLLGYAIFKDEKLIGYINGGTARGANWVNNKGETGTTIVEDSKGKEICLEIISIKSKTTPEMKDDKINIKIEINMTSDIVEYEGREDIFKEKILKDIEKQQAEIIKKEVQSAIKYAKENEVDFLGIGDAVYHKYPIEWEKKYKDKWPSMLKNVPISVDVKTKINRTHNITQPTAMKEGNKK